MHTQEDDEDAHALRKRGWSISVIARHLGHDRKTIHAYLNGERSAGVRAQAGDDMFASFADYCRERLLEDPHLWAATLFDEVTALGFDWSYQSHPQLDNLDHLTQKTLQACVASKATRSIHLGNFDERDQCDRISLIVTPIAYDG